MRRELSSFGARSKQSYYPGQVFLNPDDLALTLFQCQLLLG